MVVVVRLYLDNRRFTAERLAMAPEVKSKDIVIEFRCSNAIRNLSKYREKSTGAGRPKPQNTVLMIQQLLMKIDRMDTDS